MSFKLSFWIALAIYLLYTLCKNAERKEYIRSRKRICLIEQAENKKEREGKEVRWIERESERVEKTVRINDSDIDI